MKNRNLKFLVIASLTTIFLFFQNCSQSNIEFSTDDTQSSALGDPSVGSQTPDLEVLPVQPPEEPQEPVTPPPVCVPGKRLAVWLDPNDSGQILEQNYLGNFVSYSGTKTSAKNYNYYSDSAHPVVGPTPHGYNLNVFFYDGSDGLSLNFFANIDGTGSPDNVVNLDLQIQNNEMADSVLLSDDNLELKKVEESPTQNQHSYEGRFHYWHNTDGGVIGPLVGNQYIIKVKMLHSGDIQNATFYSANGESFSLTDMGGAVSSFIIQFEDFETCEE